MRNSVEHRSWLSWVCLRVAGALTFMVVLGLGITTTQSAQAQTFTVLYNFPGSPNGAGPYAGLVRDAAGNLYGATEAGGYTNLDAGTVFKVDASGTETVLHRFAGGGTDGCLPTANLIRDKAGNLYGTTAGCGAGGYGTVFKVDTSGTETLLHSFSGGPTDGKEPSYAGLFMDSSGNLYGVTYSGGSSNTGVVYKLSKSGTFTVLHSFAEGRKDGCNPLGNPIMDTKGNLYGVTEECGSSSGAGIVWKLSRKGTETILHRFAGGAKDGAYPLAGLIMDTKGELYGTTMGGGASGLGTLYKMTAKGKLTVLYAFAGGSTDGAYPLASLILDAKGNLYGTTQLGGAAGGGTVYKLSKTRTLTLLHSFTHTDGQNPADNVIRDVNGNLYGTALVGGG